MSRKSKTKIWRISTTNFHKFMEKMAKEPNLKTVKWQFRDICAIARDLKPSNWTAVATKQRLSFVEVDLGQTGPATILRQVVLNSSMELEAYVDNQKLTDTPFPISLSDIRSAKDFAMILRIFANYGICLGNRNFKRIKKGDANNASEYWKHGECQLLYQSNIKRPESCCDMCLGLNSYLPKKINNQRLTLRREWIDDDWDQPPVKKLKREEPVRIVIKEEPLH